jgi:signal transduction histidine kinase
MIDLTDTTRRRIGYGVIALAIAAVPTNVAALLSLGMTEEIFDQIFLGIVFPTVMVIAMRAAPRNGAVWALVWGALGGGWGAALESLAEQRTGLSLFQISEGELAASPADLDWLTAMIINLGNWVWILYFLLVIHLVLLFPTGRASSKVWRRAMWVAVGVMIVNAVVAFFSLAPWVGTPYDEIFAGPMLPAIGTANVILLLLTPVSVGNLIVRFRRSSGVERLQFRWLTWAVGVLAVTLLSGLVLTPFGLEDVARGAEDVISTLALAGIPISIGIAITKYRLYEIDLIISRSLVFVLLVGFITVVYAGVVVGIGSLIGGSSVGWSIAATALVAVVFEPVRDRVQRWVNRLVYGQRATPYEVLSDLTSRLAATEREEGLLGRMAQRLAEGTGADRAVVWTKQGSEFTPAAYAPASEGALDPVPGLDVMPGSVVPIVHDDAVLGALSVESRRGDALTPTEQRLVEDLAGSAGLLMRRLRLDAELERKAEELEESRRRLVNAQDVERRRLERQLDEGAQQRVLGLKLQLGLAEQQARAEGAERAAALIGQMALGAQDAIDQIRALAHGIYPPLLQSDGLHAALRALAEVAPVDVAVDVVVGRRYPLEVEGAVYFCVSEAVTNAVKHGEPPITVHVSDATGELVFTVADSGPGFDPTAVARGSGLDNMTDRLDALGGTFTIDTTPGSRTGLTGRLPLRPAEVSA